MTPFLARVLVPMAIEQAFPHLRFDRTLIRRLVPGLVAGILLRPRRRLHPLPRTHIPRPTHHHPIPAATILFVIPQRSGGICFFSCPTLHRTLRPHIRHKHQPLRIRRPHRPIRPARDLRALHQHRRANRPVELIPSRHVDLPADGHRHPPPIRREPPKRLPIAKRHLLLFLFVILSGGWRTRASRSRRTRGCIQRHHPQMVHLRVLLQRHIRHREQHPLPARRNLRIAHPLPSHHVRKRHRPLGLFSPQRPWFVIPQRSGGICFCPRLPSRHTHTQPGPSQTTHYNRNTAKPKSLHRASLNPLGRASQPPFHGEGLHPILGFCV